MEFSNIFHLRCQEIDSLFLSETIYILSNVSFIAVSLYILYLYAKYKGDSAFLLILALLPLTISVSSLLLNDYSNIFAKQVELISMWLFSFFYTIYVVKNIFNASAENVLVAIALFLVFSYLNLDFSREISQLQKELNQTIQYAPAFLLLCVYTMFLYIRRQGLAKYSLYATLVFLLAISFKALDASLCESIYLTTNIIWHILSAIVIYLLLYILIVEKKV